jgi:hypothetical protein
MQAESVDFHADIHGGWTLENCKQRLNEYAQQSKQPVRVNVHASGPDNHL